MNEPVESTFDRALDGTAYWTLSLYINAGSLAALYPPELRANPGDALRSAQLRHKPSFALRNAIDPLFNDIADRDFFGRPRDFLFAAGLGARDGHKSWTMVRAGDAIRTETELVFEVPPQFSWTTEGMRFHCNLQDPPQRKVRLRRFWFAHSDGALSYHHSFEHRYGGGPAGDPRDILHDPYGIQTYYFLSLLQKLAAPKEFMLGEKQLERMAGSGAEATFFNPFLSAEPTGIDPLDRIVVREQGQQAGSTFWRFMRDTFVNDVRLLLGEVLGAPGKPSDAELERLPSMSEVIEVPGLELPRCRYLFHLNDARFFDRLLPVDPVSGDGLARKQCVREQCFAPFRSMIDAVTRPHNGRPAAQAWLGAEPGQIPGLPWSEFDLTSLYEEWIGEGVFTDEVGALFPDEPALKHALHEGTARLTCDDDGHPIAPIPLHIPAYETGRADCLDYLFLAGFNQNIIDWLNQDTSEILDSIDPIYPTEDVQADERFFVRFANHRGMITYVSGSRSLEIGNDYIGTCPYAFLIHVLALHNEFLARDHESHNAREIERIDNEVQALRSSRISQAVRTRSLTLETAINDLKLDSYRKYERHRYLNIFRYDTEAAVFDKLAELRGTDWRGLAMAKALDTLEEYASDIDRRQADALAAIEEKAKEAERARVGAQEERQRERDRRLGALIGAVGLISGVGTLFSLADFVEKHPRLGLPPAGSDAGGWAVWLLGNIGWLLGLLGLGTLVVLAVLHRREIVPALRQLFARVDHAGRKGKLNKDDDRA